MGKGEIISEIGSGLYSVKIIYGGRTDHEARITYYTNRITELQAQYDSMPENTIDEIWAKRIVGLQIKALTKQRDYLQNNFPADATFDLWCVDKTTGLTGDVGTIEIPGEYDYTQYRDPNNIHVQPDTSINRDSTYNVSRDGLMYPSIGMGSWSTFLDKCMLPGWQRWKPLHRYGIISPDSIDFDNNTCDICLEASYSSQQHLPVNPSEITGQEFSDCEILGPEGFRNFCESNPTHPT